MGPQKDPPLRPRATGNGSLRWRNKPGNSEWSTWMLKAQAGSFQNHTSMALLHRGENQKSFWGLKTSKYPDEICHVKGWAQVLGLRLEWKHLFSLSPKSMSLLLYPDLPRCQLSVLFLCIEWFYSLNMLKRKDLLMWTCFSCTPPTDRVLFIIFVLFVLYPSVYSSTKELGQHFHQL